MIKIKTVSLEDLKPYENNPRKNDKAVQYVANSIKEFGFNVPLIIDKDGVIIAGHTRYEACKRLGIKDVPCVVADDLTEDQVRAFRIADNKTHEMALWDYSLLSEELAGILDVDMSAFGFVDLRGSEMAQEEDEPEYSSAGEINIEDYGDEQFNQVCPCCGFRFNED